MSFDATTPAGSPSGNTATLWHVVYLALGSNLGDRRANLATAIQKLRTQVEMQTISSLYETVPVGYLDQPDFFNLVCKGTTRSTARQILIFAQQIEIEMGRQLSFRNAPRPIDIDIILYDDLRLTEEDLIIPHPRMYERAFVLAPLAEIAPECIDPASGKSINELLYTVSQTGISRVLPIQDIRSFTERE